ncbi:MAG: choice-of-anchor J domain-containing protein, partial [Bacteroidales bacterium]|nr:choice-of-anchor J domain-containing protein [Bacteroidales bacterium]
MILPTFFLYAFSRPFSNSSADTENSKLTFSISAQSKQYAAEHYGVAISAKSNNDAKDFSIVFEETLTAGETDASSTQGQWFTKTIDLSEYAGQALYIAFRHFNCTDQFWIKLDDISLTSGMTRGNREGGEWLYYDNGVCESAAGNYDASTMQPTQIYWAIMFPADLMVDYAKRTISKVAIYDYSAHKGAFSIHTGGDDAPGTMVYVQSYETTGKKSYVELELDTPVTISGKENIWIQFSNEYGSASYPAAYSADMGDPNSRWRSDNGSLWYDANWFGEGWYGTWMIRAFVDEKDESVIDDPESTTFETLGTLVYRNGELITPTPIKENTFTDTFSADEDQVEYSIRVVYGGKKDISYYAMSCPLTKTLLTKDPMVCPAPQKLYGEPTLNPDGTFGATLVWPYAKEWLRYDDGDVVEDACIGTGNPMQWAIMFPAKDIEQYIGASITEIGLFDVEACDATLVIAYGNDFAPNQDFIVHQQDFSFTG